MYCLRGKDRRRMEITVRLPAVAGAFYPESKIELKSMISGYLRESKSLSLSRIPRGRRLRAIIVPHAGYIYSGVIAAAGFNLIKKGRLGKNPRVLLIGPSHHVAFEGLVTCSYKEWFTPLGKIEVDPLTFKMPHQYSNDVVLLNVAHAQEHCLEVELPFLQIFLPSFSLIPLITGEGDPKRFSEILSGFEKDIDLFVVSSDLSHYYPYEVAKMLDVKANEAIPALDIKKVNEEVEACGKQGILTIMHLAKKNNWQGIFVDYKNSGDTAGDKNSVVGYGCYAFYEQS